MPVALMHGVGTRPSSTSAPIVPLVGASPTVDPGRSVTTTSAPLTTSTAGGLGGAAVGVGVVAAVDPPHPAISRARTPGIATLRTCRTMALSQASNRTAAFEPRSCGHRRLAGNRIETFVDDRTDQPVDPPAAEARRPLGKPLDDR